MTPTYRDAGVDLDAADHSVRRIGPAVRGTWTDKVVGEFGGFAAGLTLPSGLIEPVLMLSTDGVGTKAEVARRAGMLDGLGSDLVAMCVDDLAAVGATPIAMTDYIAIGKLDPTVVDRLVGSIAGACREAGIALLGGETAEHPGVLAPDQFDLAGTALGVVERGAEIDGSAVRPGDRIIGIESPNLRSNGFSLIRATILEQADLFDPLPGTDSSLAEELLAPSIVYAPAVGDLVARLRPNALAHITGGGLPGNVARILPQSVTAIIRPRLWPRPPIFDTLASAVDLEEAEMFRTFNMGVGFVAITKPEDGEQAVQSLAKTGHRAWEIGDIVEGGAGVRIEGVL